jgi:D-glycero-D-manno-heptose 1,7-bisphosphate phosphatase
MSGAPAVFVDRDGTLIREVDFLISLDQMEILPRVPESIQLLRSHGFKVVVVTNQSAVARGFLREKDLQQIHHELEGRLASSSASLDAIYYCPHHPTEGLSSYRRSCDCRKPNVGMALQAATELNLNLHLSYVVGDQSGDMGLAAGIGAKGVLIEGNPGKGIHDAADAVNYVAKDLWDAAQWIIADFQSRNSEQR